MFTKPINDKNEILRIVSEQGKESKKHLWYAIKGVLFFFKSFFLALAIILPLLLVGIFITDWLMK